MMSNVTLSIEERSLRQARILALREGTSLNAVIREFIKDYIAENDHYQHLTERILQQAERSQYSSGECKWTREELYER